jgi:hypothetical protein
MATIDMSDADVERTEQVLGRVPHLDDDQAASSGRLLRSGGAR